tara:strand:- start:419 stop:781 length:363 start_codon:yes stop_codon:yes gene_type:complete
MENLLEDLIGLGVIGPLSKYGSDLSDIREITSNCQAKRGNRAYLDPVTDCMYITYANGYVRRHSIWTHYRGFPTKTMYPINRRQRIDHGRKKVLLEPDPEKRMEMLVNGIRLLRKTRGKF